ncbi:MAG: hypothetical protein LUG96_12890 [Tannerellaceae bacterium]|nr:hypothetical protein [Tannerellaceae bacterium]
MEKKLDTTKLMVETVTAALVTTSCSTDLDENLYTPLAPNVEKGVNLLDIQENELEQDFFI